MRTTEQTYLNALCDIEQKALALLEAVKAGREAVGDAYAAHRALQGPCDGLGELVDEIGEAVVDVESYLTELEKEA